MVIDSSAFVAIALKEPTTKALSELILGETSIMAAPTLLECHMVLKSQTKERAEEIITRLLSDLAIEIVPFEFEHAQAAREAFDRYGKGSDPARLNFGDCISYALAKVSGQPLLFIGNDFSQTDIKSAL